MIVRTGLTGPFPRSEELVRATRDLDRGRVAPEAVREQFAAGERAVLDLERRLELDVVTGGYLQWADLFRPFAETWRGFTVGPVTRWFETNTFYRQPILHAPPERVAGALALHLPAVTAGASAASSKVLLPGPYTFAAALDNRSGETFENLTHRLGRLLAEEVRELRSLGYATFQFQEPQLVVDPPNGPRGESALAAYRSIAAALDGATSIVWTYFGDAAPVLPWLNRLPVGVVGVDLAETEVGDLKDVGERKGLGVGCIDPRTTLVEDPVEVARVVRSLTDRFRPTVLWLGPGGPLDLLPSSAASRKLHLLPAAQQALTAGEAS